MPEMRMFHRYANQYDADEVGLLQRFEERYIPEPMSGCWLWLGNWGDGRYGHLKYEGKTLQAHRVSYQLFNGVLIQGLVIDHLCNNSVCVNPRHLSQVTGRMNVLRSNNVTANNAGKTVCLRGHELSGGNLYMSQGKRQCRKCSAGRHRGYKMGVKYATS